MLDCRNVHIMEGRMEEAGRTVGQPGQGLEMGGER